MSSDKQSYIVTSGKFTCRENGELVIKKVGEAVMLTPAQAEAFADVVKSEEVVKAEAEIAERVRKAAEAAETDAKAKAKAEAEAKAKAAASTPAPSQGTTQTSGASPQTSATSPAT